MKIFMAKMFLIFSHLLTPEQEADAWTSYGVDQFVPLPPDLQQVWSQFPPEVDALKQYISPVESWVAQQALPGDIVLVQGDFGATHLLVTFAFRHGFRPVYSTTRRETEEWVDDGGIIHADHRFKHVRFRLYEQDEES